MSAPRITVDHRRGRDVALGLPIAGAVGYIAAHSVESSRSASILVLGFAIASVLTVVFGLKRTLVFVAVIGIPFQADKNYFYDSTATAHGALGGISLSLTTLALLGLYFIWIAELALAPGQTPRPRVSSAIPGLTYLAAASASVLVASSVALSLNELALIAQSILLFIYVASNVTDSAGIRSIIRLLLLALIMEAILMLLHYYAGFNFQYGGLQSSERVEEATRAGGTIGSPNTAASFLAPCVVIAVTVLIARSVHWRALPTLGLVFGAPALIFTFSRGGWLACAVALAFVIAVFAITQ